MMTTLQIVLAIVGVSLIAAIVIYNLLQERRFRKDADKMFSHRRDDVMLGETVRTEASKRRTETRIQLTDDGERAAEASDAINAADASVPVLDLKRPAEAGGLNTLQVLETLDKPGAVRETPPPPERAEPTLSSATPAPRRVETTPRPAVAPSTQPAPTVGVEAVATPDSTQAMVSQFSGLDWETEYIARLRFATPTNAHFGPLLATLRRIGKPLRAFGRRADGAWEALSGHPRSAFDQVEFGLQLADRGGALSQDQLDAFCRALYEFTAEEGGAVSCPDKAEALQKGRELDLFCMEVDVLIGLNVMSADSRPFTSEAMHGLAEEAQLSLEADGSFHARDSFGHTLFTLANQGEEPFPRDGRGLTTHGVTLLFDVPRVADGLQVFDRMTRLGFDLAWRLEGRLVDDNGRVVSEESLNRDRARLGVFYQRMEARGIPPGGERALRLFV